MKRFIIFITTLMFMLCAGLGLCFEVSAEVWTPEVIKTETWTANYYIDPEESDTLYPYLEIFMAIYNDGHIEVIGTNTHEFDGFATVKHKIATEYSVPINDTVDNDTYNYNGKLVPKYKCSTIPYSYSWEQYSDDWYGVSIGESNNAIYYNHNIRKNNEGYYVSQEYNPSVSPARFEGTTTYLPSLKAGQVFNFELNPQKEITTEKKFNLFGHEFAITPEMLRAPAQPEEPRPTYEELLAENEQLKSANAALTEQNSILVIENDQLKSQVESLINSYYNTDFNGDGKLNVCDAVLYVKWLANRINPES